MKKLYAEWEKQDGTLLCFPHKDSPWKEYLEETRKVYCEIIYQILQVQTCLLISQNRQETKIYLQNYFITRQWDLKLLYNLYLIEMPTNDTWARDFGGITIAKMVKILH